MTTKSNWRTVSQQFMTDQRLRLGDPPTADEMLAYTRGQLTPEQEQSVRERLVSHPDLVRTLTEPFPAEGASPGDPDYMPDDEFARHWASLQNRMRRRAPAAGARVVQLWRTAAALAAMVIVALGVLLWQANARLSEPRLVSEEQVLFPDGRRGPAGQATTLTAEGESVLLVVPLVGRSEFHQYRLDIVDMEARRTTWSSTAPSPGESNSFIIVVPRRFLKPGTFQLVVYGLAGASEERLATYSLRVPR